MLLAGLILLVTFPAVVGSAAATIATAPHPAPVASDPAPTKTPEQMTLLG